MAAVRTSAEESSQKAKWRTMSHVKASDPSTSPQLDSPRQPTSASLVPPGESKQQRNSFSSMRSTFTSRSLLPVPDLSAPPSLLSLMSLGTQALIGHSSRFSPHPNGRPEFLLTSPLSLPAPNSSRVIQLRPVRKSDLDQITSMAQRSSGTTEHDRFLAPEMERYPADHKRTLHWGYTSSFHDPKCVILVAEVANAVGAGADKVKREIAGALVMRWMGKKRRSGDLDGGRGYAGLNRIQLKPILQYHLANLTYNLTFAFDRSRSRYASRAVTTAPTAYLTASDSGFDRSSVWPGVTSPDDVSTDTDAEEGDYWLITDVMVDPANTGTGIGGRVVGLATAACRERGEACVLWAVPGTEGFYEKCGFREFGRSEVPEKGTWVQMYLRPSEVESISEREGWRGDIIEGSVVPEVAIEDE